MKQRRYAWTEVFLGIVVCALLGCCQGCAMFGYRSVSLDIDVVNEGNRLLTVAGSADLPNGLPLAVSLSDSETVLKRVNTEVIKSQYGAVLDISDLNGNERYILEVSTDPTLWNEEQRRELGDYGQCMMGNQVEEEGINYCLRERIRLLLPMQKREAAIRHIQNGDYAFGISALNDVVALNGSDEEAAAWLAVALVHNNQGERHLNSRAYDIMHKIKSAKLPRELRGQCAQWLERWKNEESELKLKQERAKAIAANRQAAAQRRLEIVPGRGMADIYIGQEARAVFSVCPLAGSMDWSGEVARFDVPQRQVVVYFAPETRRVVEVATNSARLRHVSGLGVGSELQDVMRVFPGGELSWEEESQSQGEGGLDEVTEVRLGRYEHPKGIVFGLKREVLGLGLSVETVTSVSVIAP